MKRDQKLSSLSLFYPAYNEAGNIEEAVKQALSILPKIAHTFEIIVINDGSTDATLQIAKRLAATYKKVKVISQRNKGYGGALKRGFKASKYDWVFFSDSDLQFDLSELHSFLRKAPEHDLIIGYRLNRAEGWKRRLLAFALKIWNRTLLGFPRHIKDIDCAFKLIRKEVIKSIEPLFSDGAMISTELLLKSYRNGFTIAQVGVTHYERRTGQPTGNNFKVIRKAVFDTFLLQQLLVKQQLSKVTHSLAFVTKNPYTR